MLNIVHVTQCAERFGRQWLVLEVIEVNARKVKSSGPARIRLDCRVHGEHYSAHWPWTDGL
jgi:hypothetical protein